jgi:hypothetical protein
MLSYHNDPAVKAKYVARFAEHRRLDQVIQGLGFDNGRGCFVGCTLDGYDHSRFPVELGWPEWLARLADSLFERCPKESAPQFGTDLLDAVPVGVDLGPVRAAFLLTVQRRNLTRLEGSNNANYAIKCQVAIQGVIEWLEDGTKDKAVAAAAALAARAAAELAASAAESAWSAESAARAAWSAESAARASEWSAASAAESAASAAASAWSAAWSAESAARAAAWSAESAESQSQCDNLLSIIRSLAK